MGLLDKLEWITERSRSPVTGQTSSFSGTLVLHSETGECWLELADGIVLASGDGPLQAPHDDPRGAGTIIRIEGPDDEWAQLSSGRKAFAHCLHPVHGRLRSIGNPADFYPNLGSLATLFDVRDDAAWNLAPQEAPDEVTGRYADVHGAQIYFEVSGRGPVIVALHTAGGDTRQWHGVMRALAEQHRVVAFDLPGHGKSSRLPGEHLIETPDECADFAWDAIASIGIPPPIHLIGCSLGANLALKMSGLHPEATLGVIAIQPALTPPATTEEALAFMDHPHVNLPRMSAPQTVSLIGPGATEKGREQVVWMIKTRAPDVFATDMRLYTNFDIRHDVSRVRAPVLVLWGDHDWLVSETMAREVASALPDGEFRVLGGLGHFAPLEGPQAVGEAVARFVNGEKGTR